MGFIEMPAEDLLGLEYTKKGKQCTLTKAKKRLAKHIHTWIL